MTHASVDKSSKQLIIFDLDGTLIDSTGDLTLAINMMLGKISGVPVTQDHVRTWVGNGSLKLVERALIHQLLPRDEAHLHIAHELFLNGYAHKVCHHTKAYTGVHDGLMRLKDAGFLLAICTNKPKMFIPEIMAGMGWAETFDRIVAGDSLPTKKPDPTPLHHICTKLGVDAKEAVMVGDSRNDIQAGKAAGMMTLGLTYGYNYGEPLSLSRPDRTFDDFGSLVDWLLTLR